VDWKSRKLENEGVELFQKSIDCYEGDVWSIGVFAVRHLFFHFLPLFTAYLIQ